jgi:hypothetical protein
MSLGKKDHLQFRTGANQYNFTTKEWSPLTPLVTVSAAAGFDQFGCALLPNTKDQVFL